MDITPPHRATAARPPIRLAVLGLEIDDPITDAEMVAAE
jgi:hypothetical protein